MQRVRFLGAAISLLLLSAACGASDTDVPPASPTSAPEPAVIAALPEGSRDTTGGSEPRSAAYWQEWSRCGNSSRAEEAAANGGRAAGWFLMDDILRDPGVTVGGHPVPACGEAVTILDPESPNTFDELAALVLVTELSLNAGAENCEAAEQSIRAAQLALAGLSYAGPGTVDVEVGPATLQLIDLLTAYIAGDLCR